jgi:multiple sugar transport system ATP-binding protein
MVAIPAPDAGVVRADKLVLRAAVSAYLGRYRGQTRLHTESATLQAKLGTTTVYVTHDQVEAMTMGHRVCVLLDGELQQVDTPRELYDRPGNVFVAGFIGSPR